MIISPCISICKTDPSTGYCYGCGRNNEEKKIWKDENTSNEYNTYIQHMQNNTNTNNKEIKQIRNVYKTCVNIY